MNIGNRVRELRGREKLEDFAEIFKVTSSQISRIENGKSGISSDLAIAICDHFNCSLDWLMRGIEKLPIVEEPRVTYELQNKYIKALEDNNELRQRLNKQQEAEIKELQATSRG